MVAGGGGQQCTEIAEPVSAVGETPCSSHRTVPHTASAGLTERGQLLWLMVVIISVTVFSTACTVHFESSELIPVIVMGTNVILQ